MADITMCTGEGCEKFSYCYRKTARVSTLQQSYFTIPPFKLIDGKQICDEYWPNNEGQLHDKRIEQGKED